MAKDKEIKKIEGKLYNFNRMKAEVEYLKLEIEEIENDYKGCGAIGYDEKTGETYNISNPVENEILRKEKEIFKKKKEQEKIEIRIKKILNAITILNEDEEKLVQYRYFNNKTLSWETIGGLLNLSSARCKQMRVEIVDKIKDLV